MKPKINPYVIFVAFLAINIPPWFGFSYLLVVFQWGTFNRAFGPSGEVIFPITYAGALISFVLAAYWFRNGSKLSWYKTLLLAISIPFAATGVFELLWQSMNESLTLIGIILNASWVALFLGTIQFWNLRKSSFLFSSAIIVIGWILWLALGFPQVFVNGNFDWEGFFFNSFLKIGSFALLLSVIQFDKISSGTFHRQSSQMKSGPLLMGKPQQV